MLRLPIQERPNWQSLAQEYGFEFHTMYGQNYWDETAYYRFTLEQIEQDIESVTEEIHQMCLAVVEQTVSYEQKLEQCKIPQAHWQLIQDSWHNKDNSLYSRIDLAYNGNGPAKLYENNADTPTSVYETGFWQWLWLEDQVNQGYLPRHADQFNSLQEKLIQRFSEFRQAYPNQTFYFGYCKESLEDKGTVQYLADCATAAQIPIELIAIEDIGLSEQNTFTNVAHHEMQWLFKLYPWEFIFVEEYAPFIANAGCQFVEPAWKAIISNKAILPLLWQAFPNHPNLLPAFFEDDLHLAPSKLVRKPFFSREGANISLINNQHCLKTTDGPYGQEGYIYQAYHPLPQFGNNHTLIGSWLVNDTAAGLSIREDTNIITQDMSRFLPHVIL